jgi:hypothetical protein
VTLEWEQRSNGFKPDHSILTNEHVKEKCPRLLVEFYESRINFKGRATTQPNNQ